jgi:NAD(P)-dependent dehydrogenase (short-subunit alcohol dehydrogenase family)
MTDHRLDGRVCIVTGGSSGIGRASCVALARAGASVVVVGRTQERVSDSARLVRAAAREAGGQGGTLSLVLDVRDESDMAVMVRRTIDDFGRIDALVASAGVGRAAGSPMLSAPVARLSLHDWHQVIETNLTGVFLSNRAVLPIMIAQGEGWILNVSSARAGRHGYPFAAGYAASKFGVIALSDVLAREVGPLGVRVQAVLPDVTSTELLGTGSQSKVFGPALVPDRVAELVLHLLTSPPDEVIVHPWMSHVAAPGDPRIGRDFSIEVQR